MTLQGVGSCPALWCLRQSWSANGETWDFLSAFTWPTALGLPTFPSPHFRRHPLCPAHKATMAQPPWDTGHQSRARRKRLQLRGLGNLCVLLSLHIPHALDLDPELALHCLPLGLCSCCSHSLHTPAQCPSTQPSHRSSPAPFQMRSVPLLTPQSTFFVPFPSFYRPKCEFRTGQDYSTDGLSELGCPQNKTQTPESALTTVTRKSRRK